MVVQFRPEVKAYAQWMDRRLTEEVAMPQFGLDRVPTGRPSRGLVKKWTIRLTEEEDRKVRAWAAGHKLAPTEAARVLIRMGLAMTGKEVRE